MHSRFCSSRRRFLYTSRPKSASMYSAIGLNLPYKREVDSGEALECLIHVVRVPLLACLGEGAVLDYYEGY